MVRYTNGSHKCKLWDLNQSKVAVSRSVWLSKLESTKPFLHNIREIIDKVELAQDSMIAESISGLPPLQKSGSKSDDDVETSEQEQVSIDQTSLETTTEMALHPRRSNQARRQPGLQ